MAARWRKRPAAVIRVTEVHNMDVQPWVISITRDEKTIQRRGTGKKYRTVVEQVANALTSDDLAEIGVAVGDTVVIKGWPVDSDGAPTKRAITGKYRFALAIEAVTSQDAPTPTLE